MKMFILLCLLGFSSTNQPTELKFEVLSAGNGPSLSKMKGIFSINSRDELVDIWIGAKIPQIDFTSEMVIAVFRGSCPSLSYSVSVDKIEENEETVFVYIRYSNPGPNCMQLQAISSPYIFIKTQKTDKDIEFIEYEEIRECKNVN